MLVTIVATVVVLGVLIFVHELGHFLAAKSVGIGVPRFSIGFGPATPLKFRRGETEYVVAWVPLGGYVKMASREEQEGQSIMEGGATEEHFPEDKLFENKPLGARILVISAGVIMNALFAWVAYVGLAAYGRTELPSTRVVVDSTALPSAAEDLADVPPGARIAMINGDSVRTWTDVMNAIIDPGSDRLRFDFVDASPVVVPIPGGDASARGAVLDGLAPFLEPRLGTIVGGGAADRVGLQPGDVVLAVDDDTVRAWSELVAKVEPRAGDSLRLVVRRGAERLEMVVVPEEQSDPNVETGEIRKVGRIGVGVAFDTVRVRYGLLGSLREGTRETWSRTRLVLLTLKGMVLGQISPRELGGPILIGQVSGQVARTGLAPLLGFMAFLSLNLAVLNLLPIPVLDGGHLVFLAIEGILGRPLSLALRLRLTQLGLLLLLGIMALVITNDLFRVMAP